MITSVKESQFGNIGCLTITRGLRMNVVRYYRNEIIIIVNGRVDLLETAGTVCRGSVMQADVYEQF